MRKNDLILSLSLASVLATGCASTAAQTGQPVQPATASTDAPPRPAQFANRHLPPPQHLSEDVRAALKRTMNAHGDDLTMLLWSILFLDLDAASETAKGIAGRPPLTPKEDEKLGRIPPQLLVLGSQLNEQAVKLSEMSKQPERDSEGFARAFGELAQTCVRCHAVYLYEKGAAEEKK